MSGMKEIHTRMKSIQDIMKITNAMYLISSSKMKKARKSLLATEPYFNKLISTINDILLHTPEMKQIYLADRDEQRKSDPIRGFIVITADKGLAGAYNHNVIRLAEEELSKGKQNSLFVIGQVGRNYFLHKNIMIDVEFLFTAQNPTMYRARQIAETILTPYQHGQLNEVYIIYTEMVTPMKPEAKLLRILPLMKERFENTECLGHCAVFHPSPEQVMDYLVPNYVKGLIFSVLVESYSSEQYSRMTAMESATDSAKEMLKSLDLLYNRARQSAITQEISEIVSGAKGIM
jgi:F-type H+-transporting ATPase subunit gamma